jgi:hypothetical protein
MIALGCAEMLYWNDNVATNASRQVTCPNNSRISHTVIASVRAHLCSYNTAPFTTVPAYTDYYTYSATPNPLLPVPLVPPRLRKSHTTHLQTSHS